MLKLNKLFGNDKKSPALKLQAFLEGESCSLKNVPDQVFSKKILGSGMAIIPSGEVLFSPIDGTVAAVMARSGHSCCICGDKGLEILLHIGVNTVELEGKGFQLLIKNGEKVKAGDPLILFSKEIIEEADLPTVTSMIITEMGEYRRVVFKTEETVKKGDIVGELYL